MKQITVLLDNGHGAETPGKRSPDGQFREYAYCREIVKGIHEELTKSGVKSVILVPEEKDISLGERVRRANKYGKNSILISVHNNAAGNGKEWKTASGWTVWMSPNHSKDTEKLADILCSRAIVVKGNRSKLKNEANFYILKNTIMPSVLTENMFQDCKKDVTYLLSDIGKLTIIDIHVKSIIDFLLGI